MRPIYELTINEEDETGVTFNSLVDVPAHMKEFITFGEESIPYSFNEEKRMVTGVMISANTLIPRNDAKIGVHDVVFKAETIEKIRKKFMMNGFSNNLNKQHNDKDIVKGATLIDSYLIGGEKNPGVPEAFKHMNLQDGTWIASYYIEDDKLWQEVKEGKFQGFSVEGYFDRQPIQFNSEKSKNNNMKRKSIFQLLFGSEENNQNNENNEEKFETIEAIDGTVLSYDGELNVDTPLFVESVNEETGETDRLPAPEGDYQVTVDEVAIVISVNADGLVSEIQEVVEEDMKIENAKQDIRKETVEAIEGVMKDTDERFKAIETENKDLKAKNETFEAENKELKERLEKLEQFASNITDKKGEKFSATTKKAGSKKMDYRDILNKKK